MRNSFVIASLLVMLSACISEKAPTTADILTEFAAQDAQFKTNWQQDTLQTRAAPRDLQQLVDVLQNQTDALIAQNQTKLALLVASRGLMVQAQIAYARADGHGPAARANIPNFTGANLVEGVTSTLDCRLKTVYGRAAEDYSQALAFAVKSVGAFNEVVRLGNPDDARLIGLPAFYSQNFQEVQKIVHDNEQAVRLCKIG